jgi:tetratricopeptide (TPR) repeat protein
MPRSRPFKMALCPASRNSVGLSARSRLCQTAALIVILISLISAACAQPQASVRTTSKARQSSKAPSPFREAETLLNQGSVEEARKKILQQLQLHPSSVDGYNLLGIVYSGEKDYANAFAAFEHALKLDPNSVRTRNNLGNLYVTQQKFDLAEKEFRRVVQMDPANRDGNYNLGLVLMAKGSATAAIASFERVRPQNVETRFNLIHAYLEAGRTGEGLRTATELSRKQKDDVRLHFTLGVLLASEKQYKAAQIELEKADSLQPQTFEVLYNLGQVYLRSGQSSGAEAALNRALKLKPDSSDALYLLAQAEIDQARPLDALDLLVRAHKLAPDNTNVIFLMARLSMTQNYFEDAIPLLESGIKIAPQRADLDAALGESYFMAGKTEKAIEVFKTLLALDPSAASYAFMGLAYRHLGRFDEAKKYFQQGLERDPQNASCLFNLGYIEERQGNDRAAEDLFQRALNSNPRLSEALLEVANLRIAKKKFTEAAVLLRRYVKISRQPASGYYKLAMVERSLHQTAAAQRDLSVFQTLSKDASPGPYPYQHLFDYLDKRSNLAPPERAQLDLTELTEQIRAHPDQPEDLYLLAETYLKLGKSDEARPVLAQLDKLSAGDYRTQTGIGVLLARYHLYDDAIEHFRTALSANPESDDVKFDLADAYFRKGLYNEALHTLQQVSPQGQQDDALLALLGDVQAHLGDTVRAASIFRDAITRNPDNDQYYLSLTLVELRENDTAAAEQTLQKGLARIPASGKILWGLGIVSALEGNMAQAAERLERAVDLLPEWTGSYSTLGAFYYQTGQFDKAREVLNRFKGSHAGGGLDVNRIEEALARAPATSSSSPEPMSRVARQQLLQLALSLADRTL